MVRAMIPVRQDTCMVACNNSDPSYKLFHDCSSQGKSSLHYLSFKLNILVISGLVRLKVHMTMEKMKESGDNSGSNSIGEDSYKDTDSDKNSHRIVI